MAFGRTEEAALVDALRAAPASHVSLVAVEGGRVVGHIFFSPVSIESEGPTLRAPGLGPMAVLPECQGRGVGSELAREGLSECRRGGWKVVVVLGHPGYYPRFVFVPAAGKGLRALLGRVPSLVELVTRTNELLHATTPSNKFVTAILIEVTPSTGEARYVNAGHGDCLLLRAGGAEVERLESTGLPLGMMPPDVLEMLGKGYEERRVRIGEGDLLALYLDGVTEAYDEAENEWGDERLLECLRPASAAPARDIVERVFEEIDRFAGAAPQHDDITLLVLKRAGQPATPA